VNQLNKKLNGTVKNMNYSQEKVNFRVFGVVRIQFGMDNRQRRAQFRARDGNQRLRKAGVGQFQFSHKKSKLRGSFSGRIFSALTHGILAKNSARGGFHRGASG
jgi:hypothetical protein